MNAASSYLAALPGGVVEFSTSAFDRIGLPTWASVWWGRDGIPTDWGHGYGPTEEAALTSARGEVAEHVLLIRALRASHPRRASYRELVQERGHSGVVDPLTLCLEAGSGYTADMPLDWVPLRRWTIDGSLGDQVFVPIDFLVPNAASRCRALPAGGALVVPITNGIGAGDSLERAIAHALGELLQRDGNGLHFRALDEGIVLDLGPDDADVRDPDTRVALARMRAAGLRVLPKLASTSFSMSNVYVVGDDDEPALPLVLTSAGEAAHPDREAALRKAVHEYAASRARKALTHGPLDMVAELTPPGHLGQWIAQLGTQEPRALDGTIRWLTLDVAAMRELLSPHVLGQHRTVRFADLPTVPQGSLDDPSALCAELTQRLTAQGFDVLVFDASADGVAAVKVVVPGLEVETMSYHRIGERGVADLLARGDGSTGLHGIVGIGPTPRGGLPVLLPDVSYERLGGKPWLDPAAVDRVVGELYPMYREPARHAAQLARVAAPA